MLLVLISSITTSFAHVVENLCWNNGKFSFKATQLPNGAATVKVYTNSSYSGTPVQTFTLNVTGSQISYEVNQPDRTVIRYVKVTWSDGYKNYDATGTNQCVIIEKLCWNQGKYIFRAQAPNGTATVKVYKNSNYTNLLQQFDMTVVGLNHVYEVEQEFRTVKVYVKVTWYGGDKSKDPTGTNQCSLTPITFGQIDAKNIGDNTEVTFQVSSTDENNQITLNFNMPDGSIKKYPIIFLDKLVYGDIWVVTVNNKTGKYTIKKK